MPTLRLTDAAIKRLRKPERGRAEFWDSHTKGFGLRYSVSGVRSWVVITRSLQAGQWKQQRVTLGQYPALSLAQAREKAEQAKALAKQGEDPAASVRDEQQRRVDDSRNTFAAVRGEFLERYRGRQNRRPAPSTLSEMTRVLSADDFSDWSDVPLAKITKRDILDVLDQIVGRGSETMANRTLAYLKLLFGWAQERGIVETNPSAEVKKPGGEVSRDRVLSADELRMIWDASASEASQFNSIVRLLMLTGQRLNEVAQLRWSEIDSQANVWRLPAERAKNHREHVVPLTTPALAILESRAQAQKQLATPDKPAPQLVFTTTGETPFSGFSRGKSLLDKRLHRAMAAAHPESEQSPLLAPWRLHDIRRSVATHMAEDLRIAPHVIEACLNHVSGTKAGVAGIYNRALHLDERRDALQAWSDHVLRLTGAPPAEPEAAPA
jgi:integrase